MRKRRNANAGYTNLVIYTVQKLCGAFYFYIAVSFFFLYHNEVCCI